MQYIAGSKFVPADPTERAAFNEKMRTAKQVRQIVDDNPGFLLDDHNSKNDGTKAELSRVQGELKAAKQNKVAVDAQIASIVSGNNFSNGLIPNNGSAFAPSPTADIVNALNQQTINDLTAAQQAYQLQQQMSQFQNYVQSMQQQMQLFSSMRDSLSSNSGSSSNALQSSGSNALQASDPSATLQHLVDTQTKLAQISQIQQLMGFMQKLSDASASGSHTIADQSITKEA